MSENTTDYMTMQQALMAIGQYVDDTKAAEKAEAKILKAYNAVTVRFRNNTLTLNGGKLVGTRLSSFWRTSAGRIIAAERPKHYRFRVNGRVRQTHYVVKAGDTVEVIRPYSRRHA